MLKAPRLDFLSVSGVSLAGVGGQPNCGRSPGRYIDEDSCDYRLLVGICRKNGREL